MVRKLLETEKDQSVAHRRDHLDRVRRRALKLARSIPEGEIDLEVLSMAALLHDVDQPYHDKKGHVTRSLEKAEKILRDLGYPEDKRPWVLEAIAEHSSEDESSQSSLEAKLLFDADKLDGLGAIGIARVFAFSGQRGLPPAEALEWYRSKIERAIPMMQTEAGRQAGARDLAYVNSFFTRYREEEEALL
ncbi:MAG TPA: HD domain-containing protein [Methanothrix sp.]|nr:HD domain-containing protein [Methanothrix sp.]HPJ83345.1 HD domain-containing protein [Methanothrix sp.]HPR65605.1 HD domain-containing protein [Methanothrix sp.]